MTLNLGRVYPLCCCGHTAHGHNNQHGVCERCDSCDAYVAAPDWPILPRKAPSSPADARLLDDLRGIVKARHHECYGSPWQGTDMQADELARAVLQRFYLGGEQ